MCFARFECMSRKEDVDGITKTILPFHRPILPTVPIGSYYQSGNWVCKICCGLTQHDLTWCVKVQEEEEEEEVDGVGGGTRNLLASVDSQPLTLQGVTMLMVLMVVRMTMVMMMIVDCV